MKADKIRDSILVLKTTKRHMSEEKQRLSNLIFPKIVTDNDKDMWHLKALPLNVSHSSKPSNFIQVFLKKNETKYTDLVNGMTQELERVNEDTNLQIKILANESKLELKTIEAIIQEQRERITITKLERKYLPKLEDFDEAWKTVKKLTNQKKELLRTLHNELMEVERIGSATAKEIFKKYYISQQKLAYKLPSEIQALFEYEIMNRNQMMLNNIRCYHNLYLLLYLQAEQTQLYFKEYFRKCKKLWEQVSKLLAIQILLGESEDPHISERMFLRSEEGKKVCASFQLQQEMFSGKIDKWKTELVYSRDSISQWHADMDIATAHIDATAKEMLELYKAATSQIFLTLSKEMEISITHLDDLATDDVAFVPNDLRLLEDKVFKPFTSIKEKYQLNFTDLEMQRDDVMQEMQKTLEDMFNFLNDAANLWERHTHRIQESKNIINTALDKFVSKVQKEIDSHEVNINVAIDKLRQESDTAKLPKALEDVRALLDQLKTKYKDQFILQRQAVECFLDLASKGADVLLAEMEQFLEKNPSNHVNKYIEQQVLKLQTVGSISVLNEEEVLSNEFKIYEYQVSALKNWRFGLREGLQYYQKWAKKDVMNNSNEWTREMTALLEQHLNDRLALHEPRYERIVLEIHDVRLAELEMHSDRLKCHKLGIKQHLDEIAQQTEELLKTEKRIMKSMDKSLAEVTKKGQSSVTSGKVRTLMAEVDKINEKAIETLQFNIWQFQEECDSRIGWIRESNVNFIKVIKLFSEGGNFSADETNKFTKELQMLDKDIDKQESNVLKKVGGHEVTLVEAANKKATMIKESMKRILDAVGFYEKSENALMKVKENIKSEVAHMKYDMKILTHKTDEIIEALLHPDRIYVNSMFEERWKPLLNAVKQHHDYLLQPTSFDTGPPDQKLMQLAFSFKGFIAAKENNQHPSVKISRSTKQFTNYREILFSSPQPPFVDNNFMSILCACLWDTIGELQDAASEFYSEKPTEYKVKIPPSYDDFFEDLLDKFQYYHIQFEAVWLDEIHAFLALVNKLQNIAKSYVELAFMQFHICYKRTLFEMHKSYVEDFNTESVIDNGELDRLYEELKTTHGHPGHWQLLEDLHKEVESAYVIYHDKWLLIANQYLKSLDKKDDDYHEDIEELCQPLRTLQDLLFNSLKDDLILQVETVLQGIEEATKVAEEPEPKPNLPQRLVNKRLQYKGREKKKSKIISQPLIQTRRRSQIPIQHSLSFELDNFYIKALKSRIEVLRQESCQLSNQMVSTIPISSVSEEPESVPIMGLCPTTIVPCDLADKLNQLYTDFHHQQEDYKMQADHIISDYISSLDASFSFWNENVDSVQKLYKVRYD